jgi:TM2 domain-containing membrane protein YozV
MRGQVLGVDARTGDGLVAGDDGRRYRFRPEDWAQRGEPAIGVQVDFETADERALNVFPLAMTDAPRSPVPTRIELRTDRNKFIAALLAFFFGVFGLHRFYLGRTGSGVAMLILSITVIGLVISAPWALIDTIRYLMMSDREFTQRYARIEELLKLER